MSEPQTSAGPLAEMSQPGRACPKGPIDGLLLGLACYCCSTLVVVLGVLLGHRFIPPPGPPPNARGDLLGAFANWDGQWYSRIVTEGHSYDPDQPSSVAFFPVYPLLGRAVVALTGLRPELALLLVSHLCLLGTFVLLGAYVRVRCPDGPAGLEGWALLSLAFFPTTLFCRMAYTESLFLCLTVLLLYGMERQWPLAVLALVAGLATATRAPGIALVAPLLLHAWQRSNSVAGWAGRACWLLPLGCWGLGGWMFYQWQAFGEPLAFARTQSNWQVRPPFGWDDKLVALLTLEPIWSVFVPSSPAYWGRVEPGNEPLLSLHVSNPIYFSFAAGMVLLGWRRRWLNSREVVLAGCLLLIPYVASSYEMYLAGAARFAAAVLPAYLVLGHLLSRAPGVVAGGLLGVSGFLLGAYSALFASWHRFF